MTDTAADKLEFQIGAVLLIVVILIIGAMIVQAFNGAFSQDRTTENQRAFAKIQCGDMDWQIVNICDGEYGSLQINKSFAVICKQGLDNRSYNAICNVAA